MAQVWMVLFLAFAGFMYLLLHFAQYAASTHWLVAVGAVGCTFLMVWCCVKILLQEGEK